MDTNDKNNSWRKAIDLVSKQKNRNCPLGPKGEEPSEPIKDFEGLPSDS